LGGQVAHPGRQVVTITGDGCLMMSAVEMSTTDIGMEFAKLIQTQQSYTMAARAYSVIEEMVQTATRLKV
jgi:flagellar hook protein FlgE